MDFIVSKISFSFPISSVPSQLHTSALLSLPYTYWLYVITSLSSCDSCITVCLPYPGKEDFTSQSIFLTLDLTFLLHFPCLPFFLQPFHPLQFLIISHCYLISLHSILFPVYLSAFNPSDLYATQFTTPVPHYMLFPFHFSLSLFFLFLLIFLFPHFHFTSVHVFLLLYYIPLLYLFSCPFSFVVFQSTSFPFHRSNHHTLALPAWQILLQIGNHLASLVRPFPSPWKTCLDMHMRLLFHLSI